MSASLVQSDTDESSVDVLNKFYEHGFIPAEKKPFLVDLQKSWGPYLAIRDSDQFILDGCSQIATLGLGFNASPLFAPCHHAEAWTGNFQTENITAIASAYRNLLRRLLGNQSREHHVHFCASGAEAVEIGLGVCFANRKSKSANKVLAFQGSFHGRMMVALASTWNIKKRKPFRWPGYESEFVSYPMIHAEGDLVEREQTTLEQVRTKLETGRIFAAIVEPMQCEGGDRYASSNFHRQLLKLLRSFDVPLVYDEVQTGFHLGNRFFWHTQFGLENENGIPDQPDVVVCAKKSQVGVVVSRLPIRYPETFCPAALIRGYSVAGVLDQFQEKIVNIGQSSERHLTNFANRHPGLVSHQRGQGLCFAFDLPNAESVGRFVKARFQNGLLFYPAGQKTARFRLNLGFDEPKIELLFQQIENCLTGQNLTNGKVQIGDDVKTKTQFEFNWEVAESRLATLNDQTPITQPIEYLQRELIRFEFADLKIVLLDAKNYSEYREQILAMQASVYEPARQSPPGEFDALFAQMDPKSIGVLILDGNEIQAMGFCGSLNLFRQERGVSHDPLVDDPHTNYMLDLTVTEKHRGGLGRILKNALVLVAKECGVRSIRGRNRDRYAAGMWAINLSLGAFELKHLSHDYPDNKPHRDCIYYQMPVAWASETDDKKLPFQTTSISQLDQTFFRRNMPTLVNKVCLSNFINQEYLEDLSAFANCLPSSLRKFYTASSLSESIDKIAKVLWLKRKPNNKLLTIDGHFFGAGSFLARSLSGIDEPFFETKRIADQRVVEELGSAVANDEWLGFFVEAERFIGREDTLAECIEICRQNTIPIVYNESGRRFGTESQLSLQDQLAPDAGVAWLGGAMAIAYCRDLYFNAQPLMFISTWDGDAFSLARFVHTIQRKK